MPRLLTCCICHTDIQDEATSALIGYDNVEAENVRVCTCCIVPALVETYGFKSDGKTLYLEKNHDDDEGGHHCSDN